MLAIDLGISTVLSLATMVKAFEFYSIQSSPMIILSTTVFSMAYFVGFAVVLGWGIEKIRSTSLNWNSWLETLFLSLLP